MTENILTSLKDNKPEILFHLIHSGRSCSEYQLSSSFKDRVILFNRFLWKDYSSREMEIATANAAHIVIKYKGTIEPYAFVKGLTILLERHKSLNSSVEMSNDNLYLAHHSKQTPVFQEIFIKGKTLRIREEKAIRIANDLTWEEYNLDKGPLYRVFLLKISVTDYILGVGLHHAISDMFSINVFFQELLTLYNSIVTGAPLELPPVPFQYMDYLSSMEEWSTSRACDEHIDYWKDRLRSTPVTDLFPDWRLSFEKSFTGSSAVKKVSLDFSATHDLKNMAVKLRKTLFCLLLALHKITIWKMTGQEEQVIIALQAGRTNSDYKNIIGNIAMEIAYKTDLSGNPDFIEITERVSRTMSESLSHQPVPLDWVRQKLADDGIFLRAPGMSFIPDSKEHDSEIIQHLRFDPPGVPHGCHDFPVSYSIEFREIRGIIEASMTYRKDLYSESTILTFLDHFRKNISEVINTPDKKLYDFKRDLNFTYY